MTIEHDDDLLLDALAAGSAFDQSDELAGLLAAWRADLEADPLPGLRPAAFPVPVAPVNGGRVPFPRRLFRRTSATPALPDGASPAGRRRMPRPLVVAAAAAVLVFGGLTVASASAQPGTPLWPLTRVIFGDTAKTRVAVSEAEKVLDQARAAMNAGDRLKAAQLVEAARVQIGQITDEGARQRLTDEADALWDQIRQMPLTAGTPLPGQSGAPGTPAPTPTTGDGGILPPILPSILPTLPPLLPSLLPSLPHLPLLG
jgi:hypothetical protein